MNAEQIITISTVVVLLTQFVKWGGLPDRRGPIVVALIAAVGVGVFRWSTLPDLPISARDAWPLFAAWVAVTAAAAGTFGFTRALPGVVASFQSPTPRG